jgi:hypothetical protein
VGLGASMYRDTALTAAANLPGNLAAVYLTDRIGRRALLRSAPPSSLPISTHTTSASHTCVDRKSELAEICLRF